MAYRKRFAVLHRHLATVRRRTMSRFAEQRIYPCRTDIRQTSTHVWQCGRSGQHHYGIAAKIGPTHDERTDVHIFAWHYSALATGQFIFGCARTVAQLHSTVAILLQSHDTRITVNWRCHSQAIRTVHRRKCDRLHTDIRADVATFWASWFWVNQKCPYVVSPYKSIWPIEFGRYCACHRIGSHHK